jgi:hypothetical protein
VILDAEHAFVHPAGGDGMDAKEILATLEKLGKPKTAAIHRRH